VSWTKTLEEKVVEYFAHLASHEDSQASDLDKPSAVRDVHAAGRDLAQAIVDEIHPPAEDASGGKSGGGKAKA
jgi:hypothetical protein